MNKRGMALIWIILAVVVLAAAVYFTFFFTYGCKDLSCFRSHQEKCSHTKFVNDAEDTVWEYRIMGKDDGKCEIKVEVVQVKAGGVERRVLEGQSMNCFLTVGNLASPEADISKCHGRLKEELQKIIINKLHAYVIENLGEIGDELSGIIPAVEPVVNDSGNETA